MSASVSEEYLSQLVNRTFLKLWTFPNPYRSPGKELTDVIVPFGDDVIIISDKASDFSEIAGLDLAWSRWARETIEGSIRQLGGAKRRVEMNTSGIFTDAAATMSLPYSLGPADRRRYHLVGIARPRKVPGKTPASWPGLHYVAKPSGAPFQIGPLSTGGVFVHLFDGPTIDLLLQTLDTAPDFISYLSARAESLSQSTDYDFEEKDFLASSISNWSAGSGLSPSPPAADRVEAGLWEEYCNSDRKRRSDELNLRSRAIDRFIAQHHEEYTEDRLIGDRPAYAAHEYAMRLLAGESRFARRMIADELYDLLGEDDRTTYWAATLPSPTSKQLRYVWMIFPQPSAERSNSAVELDLLNRLKIHILIARALFNEPIVLGIALPNVGVENIQIIDVLDGSNWTDADRERALKLQRETGIFNKLVEQKRWHVP